MKRVTTSTQPTATDTLNQIEIYRDRSSTMPMLSRRDTNFRLVASIFHAVSRGIVAALNDQSDDSIVAFVGKLGRADPSLDRTLTGRNIAGNGQETAQELRDEV